jgi:hypothetical protein
MLVTVYYFDSYFYIQNECKDIEGVESTIKQLLDIAQREYDMDPALMSKVEVVLPKPKPMEKESS